MATIFPSRALRCLPRRVRYMIFARSNLASWSRMPSACSPSGESSPRRGELPGAAAGERAGPALFDALGMMQQLGAIPEPGQGGS